jgi:glycosyltransferase involved in cell wall biosynthesis
MFYPAATWPHKNHKNLLLALKIMVDHHGFDGELLLTGITKQSNSAILDEISRLGLANRVKLPGYVATDDLPHLYNLARMLVFPSLFEGFGIPLVEAMACGCPVVCSNTTCLPEVLGGAGGLFDPLAPDGMADKIWSIWNDDDRLSEMRRLGLERAGLFTWKKAASETIKVYSKAIESDV